MLAEIDMALANNEYVRALGQLDERNARGEALVVIDGQALHKHLTREVEALPMAAARAKVYELQVLFAAQANPGCGQVSNLAVAEGTQIAPPPVAAEVKNPAPTAALIAFGLPADGAKSKTGSAPIAAHPKRVPLRLAGQKSMHQRLTEAVSASACIGIIATSIWAGSLMPIHDGMKAPWAAMIEPAAIWLGMQLSE